MAVGIGRRQFISALGGAAACVIGATQRAHAQTTPKPLRLGFVHPVSPKDVPPNYAAFVGPLRELGYVEGDTLAIDYINLGGHLDRNLKTAKTLGITFPLTFLATADAVIE